MDVFSLRNQLIRDYRSYISGFIRIKDPAIRAYIDQEFDTGTLWPDPLVQLNPSFEPGATVDGLVAEGVLHPACASIFREDKDKVPEGRPLRLHLHQEQAIRIAQTGKPYILTTGTGSGKSLTYIIPMVDGILRRGRGHGIQAIIVYPMNALANSQMGELEKFLKLGEAAKNDWVRVARYTGQESSDEREQVMADPPDILITNYVMLELILTRSRERPLVRHARGLRMLAFDEMHTYRGRQGSDVALLIRRVRDSLQAPNVQLVGTSATLSTADRLSEQQAQIADVGTRLFGALVAPEHVIGETLRRVTDATELSDPAFKARLSECVASGALPANYQAFNADPLAIWIENTLGLAESDGRLVRATPISITDASKLLAQAVSQTPEHCAEAIRALLSKAYRLKNPVNGRSALAFRLHQFISRGGAVYASLDTRSERDLSFNAQTYVPDRTRDKVRIPLVFCRQCGQEYYSVVRQEDPAGRSTFVAREPGGHVADGTVGTEGYLYLGEWPEDQAAQTGRVPDDFLEDQNGILVIKRSMRAKLPEALRVAPNGQENPDGLPVRWMEEPIRFCLSCGAGYSGFGRNDFARVGSLATEGRSSATSILVLSTLRFLQDVPELELPDEARKLLSFIDNRQDAALQAGHFNDFIQVSALRAAVYRAALRSGDHGLRAEQLAQGVFDALALSPTKYAVTPDAKYNAKSENERALREVLGYRIFRDMERGWRFLTPNLEQTGLLQVDYESLTEICADQDLWRESHAALAAAKPGVREKVATVLLDELRRRLAIYADYLTDATIERISINSQQRLIEPWILDRDEDGLTRSRLAFARPKAGDRADHVFLSSRSAFGLYLRRPGILEYASKLTLNETQTIIEQLCKVLSDAGLLVPVEEDRQGNPGYQLQAASLIWRAGDGDRIAPDPLRMPGEPEGGQQPNPFFLDFYQILAHQLAGMEAAEHTAQVPDEVREQREKAFGSAELPVLFCSPTMELGVEIKQLNVVNMRNVPPTPANYTQRSGRAGRSGQPALVFTYCSNTSGHDQYFFRRPERMVKGAVTPPRLDLSNEDLVRAHINAIWLEESGLSLGSTLADVLDLSGDEPSLALQSHVTAALTDTAALERTRERGRRLLRTLTEMDSPWGGDQAERWLNRALADLPDAFDRACDRWRSRYRAALAQRDAQDRIIRSGSTQGHEVRTAQTMRQTAEDQLKLLKERQNTEASDFNSYRYLATEGLTPGYGFPKLPVTAYLPGSGRRKKDTLLNRPRFLALVEFGPRQIVYSEGARYRIRTVQLEASDEGSAPFSDGLAVCPTCGYGHLRSDQIGPDTCQRCGVALDYSYEGLLQIRNVDAQRVRRITSDEETRRRQGYELVTAFRFSEREGHTAKRSAQFRTDGQTVLTLTYGPSARLWQVNLGWKRRPNRDIYGFALNTVTGVWAPNVMDGEDQDTGWGGSGTRLVIPYVEDTKNVLLIEPTDGLDEPTLVSLAAALDRGIQARYELEDRELAMVLVPSGSAAPRGILFYEASEGGAGVLRRLIDDANGLADVAREALAICHFDPATGADLEHAPKSTERCDAACYDCLMSYSNQQQHARLDRFKVRDLLLTLQRGQATAWAGDVSREEKLRRLMNSSDSQLERQWLEFMARKGLRLPDRAQALIEECGTRPDFYYPGDYKAAIYIDGPHHAFPERVTRDAAQNECLDSQGIEVIRFGHQDDWDVIVAKYKGLFGE